MDQRKAVTRVTAERYRVSGKKGKGRILDELTALTGYNRTYAARVLRAAGKKVNRGRRADASSSRRKRPTRKLYDERVFSVLVKVWKVLDFICGKRLRPVLGETIERLERFGEITCDAETRQRLRRISGATIDRLLTEERRKYQLKGRARTRPGSLLKKQIPMRTFSEWDEKKPGFVEIDLVAHDGGFGFGDYLQTLDLTDIYSGWTEMAALTNKAQVWVFEAIKEMRVRLPFTLFGIDSDNGSEFINHQLYRYCRDERITFTRSRPYRKNDNCFVEQKNYTVVRRHVGYQRFEGDEHRRMLNDLYRYLRLYVNYFQPSMRLVSKERCGAMVKKRYSPAETPCQRLLASAFLSDKQKQKMREQYTELNPAELKRRIESLQEKLLKKAVLVKQKTASYRTTHPWHEPVVSIQDQKHLE